MKGMRYVCVAIILTLVVIAAILGRAYQEQKNRVGTAEWYMTGVTTDSVGNVENMIYLLPYMVKDNVSNAVIADYLSSCSSYFEDVSHESLGLYNLTGDARYRYFSSAMDNLGTYFNVMSNKYMGLNPHQGRQMLTQDMGILMNITKELDVIVRERGGRDMTLEQAERLNNLTAELFNVTAMMRQALHSVEQLANQTNQS